MLISLPEFLSFLFCLCGRAAHYSGIPLAYDGDNDNAISRIKYRNPRNRAAQSPARILDRLETEFKFPLVLYHQGKCHMWRNSPSRFFTDTERDSPTRWSKYIDAFSTFNWFLTERLGNMSLILPSDFTDRAKKKHAVVGETIVATNPNAPLRRFEILFFGHAMYLAASCSRAPGIIWPFYGATGVAIRA